MTLPLLASLTQSPLSNVSLLFPMSHLLRLSRRREDASAIETKPAEGSRSTSLWRSESSTSLYQYRHRLCRWNPKQPLPLRKPYLRRPLPRFLRRIFSRSGGTRMKFEACTKATSGLSVACFGKTLAPPCLNSNRVISLSSLLPEVITFFFHSLLIK